MVKRAQKSKRVLAVTVHKNFMQQLGRLGKGEQKTNRQQSENKCNSKWKKNEKKFFFFVY